MSKKTTQRSAKVGDALSIDAANCRLGKISNNLEVHGDEHVSEFSIPVEGIMLTAEQVKALLADPDADIALFQDEDDSGVVRPAKWCSKASLELRDRYDGATATFGLTGDRELEYRDCRLNKITLEPQDGGVTRMDFQLQLCPGLDQGNLLLQEHQYHEITLSIANAKIALKKKDRQQELPLEQAKPAAAEASKPEPPPPAAKASGRKRATKARRGRNGETRPH